MKLNSRNYREFFSSNPNIDLTTLGYEELRLLAQYISTITDYGSKLYKEYAAKRQSTYQENRKAREEKARIFSNTVLPKINEWAIKNLKKGSRIKVKGTRDSVGLRELLEDYNGKGSLLCLQIHLWNGKESVGQVTSHGIDKLSQVSVGGQFVKVTSLI